MLQCHSECLSCVTTTIKGHKNPYSHEGFIPTSF